MYPVYEYNKRKIVLVPLEKITIPFYKSTGLGGKRNVPAGAWYPILGMGKDGWFNKTTEWEIVECYHPTLKRISEELGDSDPLTDIHLNTEDAVKLINGALGVTGINYFDYSDTLQKNKEYILCRL